MYNHSADNKAIVGSRQAWILTRIMEIAVFVLLLVFVLPALLWSSVFRTAGENLPAFLMLFAALLFGGLAHSHQIVFGIADAEGIRYKRYLRWEHLDWNNIESIASKPIGTIRVDVKGKYLLGRQLIFIGNGVLSGRDTKQLDFETVRRIWIRATTPNEPFEPNKRP